MTKTIIIIYKRIRRRALQVVNVTYTTLHHGYHCQTYTKTLPSKCHSWKFEKLKNLQKSRYTAQPTHSRLGTDESKHIYNYNGLEGPRSPSSSTHIPPLDRLCPFKAHCNIPLPLHLYTLHDIPIHSLLFPSIPVHTPLSSKAVFTFHSNPSWFTSHDTYSAFLRPNR